LTVLCSIVPSPHGLSTQIVNILNYSRRATADAVNKLMEVRLQHAKAQAQLAVAVERVERMRERLVRERMAKQKAVLKSVREILRQSDVRVKLHDIEVAAR